MSIDLISLDFIREIAQDYGYWAVFFGISLENAGLPIPGETVTLVGGFLAGSGDLDYWGVLGSATVGAILGDNFGYWIGRQVGWSFLHWIGEIFRIEETQLLNLKTQVSNNAAKAVFFGRFVALLRIFAGPLAGIVQMPYWKFLLYNSTGALVWATTIVTIAYAAGQIVSLETLAAWISQFGLLVILPLGAWVAGTIWWESRKHRSLAETTEVVDLSDSKSTEVSCCNASE